MLYSSNITFCLRDKTLFSDNAQQICTRLYGGCLTSSYVATLDYFTLLGAWFVDILYSRLRGVVLENCSGLSLNFSPVHSWNSPCIWSRGRSLHRVGELGTQYNRVSFSRCMTDPCDAG